MPEVRILNILTRVRDRLFLLLKMRACILSDGYFLNAPVYGGRAEGKRAFRPASLPLFDSCNPLP